MKKLSYKKSGVNINKANLFIKKIKPIVKTTARPGSLGTIGAFAGFFKPAVSSYKEPVLVASTDGVGTKLMVANWAGKHDTVGIDLVAMCVNDIIVTGAEPLFFLDYFATGRLLPKVSCEVIKGIAKGCRLANCALIGGETAELPGMYKRGDYDLAGFSVGIVDRKKIIDGSKIRNRDLILGLASSGLHSNGYSLVRKVFSKKELKGSLAASVLKPTTIYVKPVLGATKRFNVKAIANITGGGFYDNIIRTLPPFAKATIKLNTWPVSPIFRSIKEKGKIGDREMFRTFNMGIGMTIVLPAKEAASAKRYFLKKHKLKSWVIGEITWGKRRVEVV